MALHKKKFFLKGKGNVVINGRDFEEYFGRSTTKMVMKQPLHLTESSEKYDIFWKNTFEELAYGRCPYGIYIHKDNICCNYKDKKFCYDIDNNRDSEMFLMVAFLLRFGSLPCL